MISSLSSATLWEDIEEMVPVSWRCAVIGQEATHAKWNKGNYE